MNLRLRCLACFALLVITTDAMAERGELPFRYDRFITLTNTGLPCLNGKSQPCRIEAEEADTRDRRGLRRDTWYFLGYQAATIVILYAAPESVSGWSDQQKDEYSMSVWWENVTHPAWDEDDLFINYVLHPYWGAAYFVRARERGYSEKQAFWYSALLSSAYEFGAEALFEQPSIQDLIVTPVFGSMLGRYFMHVRDGVREREVARGYRATGDKWLWVLTDPLGSLNRRFDKWFGWEAELQFRPYYREYKPVRHSPPGSMEPGNAREFGVSFSVTWQ